MARKQVNVETLPQLTSMFDECGWAAVSSDVNWFSFHGTLRSMRERVRSSFPEYPGVYAMVNAQGHVVYVGMSKQLPKRLQTYFSSTTKRKKESWIRRTAVGFLWQPFPHPLLARLRERELIRRFRPMINVQGHPVQMKVGYIVATQQTAESFQLVTEIPKQHAGIWGPVPVKQLTKSAVEELNIQFGLRDCPKRTAMYFNGDKQAPDTVPITCMRAELKTCLAPCLGSCTEGKYQRAFKSAKSFLSGRSQKVFSQIEEEMTKVALNRQFELAARLRDRTKGFRYVNDHLRRFHDWSSRANFVYPVQCELSQAELWVIVVRGIIVDVVPTPKETEDRTQVASMIETSRKQLSGESAKRNVSEPGDFEAARILFRWFQKESDETQKQFSLTQALKRLNANKRKAS